MIETIDTFENPMKVKDTYRGKILREKRDQLYKMIDDVKNKYTH